MKISKSIWVLGAMMLLAVFMLTGCFVEEQDIALTENPDMQSYDSADFKNINVEPHEKKPFTIMVYLNGTNLETDGGYASTDIAEMFESGFDSENVNILICTGGTNEWHNEAITPDATRIYSIQDGALFEEADLGDSAISDWKTISFMLNYGMTAYPADKYGCIFWNHGGGPIFGYASDEKNEEASLSINQIAKAFSVSKAKNKKMEFIGFDACLMASMEVAKVLSPYCKYLVASEETEPGCGWNYAEWLKVFDGNPQANGKEIGKSIVDSFIAVCEDMEQEGTLSVIDSSKIPALEEAVNQFSNASKSKLSSGKFNKISRARSKSKSFGFLGEDEGSYDLVDICDMAKRMDAIVPNQAQALQAAIKKAVVYHKNTSFVAPGAYGLTTYMPYVSPDMAEYSVNEYKSSGLFPIYEKFLESFARKMTGQRAKRPEIAKAQPEMSKASGGKQEIAIKLSSEQMDEINSIRFVIWRQLEKDSDYFIQLGDDSNVDIQPNGKIATKFDGYWTTLCGEPICLYEVEKSDTMARFHAPVQLNGKAVNLIVIKDKKTPEGRIVGAIPEKSKKSHMAPKNIIQVKEGDEITLEYYAELFLANKADAAKYDVNHKWVKGNKVTLDTLNLKVEPVGNELYLYGFLIKDTQNNKYFTNFIEIRY